MIVKLRIRTDYRNSWMLFDLSINKFIFHRPVKIGPAIIWYDDIDGTLDNRDYYENGKLLILGEEYY